MSPFFRFFWVFLFGTLLFWTSNIARAETSDPQQARELFNQGIEAAQNENFEDAVRFFQQSYDLYPLSGTLLNLGLFQIRVERHIEAYSTFQLLLERYGGEISERARIEVNRRLRELETELASLWITSQPEGATISINGQDRGLTPMDSPVFLEPGAYTVEAHLEGYQPARQQRDLQPGQNPPLELSLEELADPPPEIHIVETPDETLTPEEPDEHESETTPDLNLDPNETETTDEPRRSHWRRPWPWIIIGVVVVGATAASLAITLPEDDPQPDLTLRVP